MSRLQVMDSLDHAAAYSVVRHGEFGFETIASFPISLQGDSDVPWVAARANARSYVAARVESTNNVRVSSGWAGTEWGSVANTSKGLREAG